MPNLTVTAQPDAEIMLIDGSLTLVQRSVGQVSKALEPGLYKVKVERGGGLREELVALREDTALDMPVTDFPAVAPMRSILGDQAPEIERLARQALREPAGEAQGETVLLMCHRPNGCRHEDRPFQRLGLFPFGRTRDRVALTGPFPTATLGSGDVWAAAAIRLPSRTRTGVLEILEGQRVLEEGGTTRRTASRSRHSVLLAPGWQSRVFLRYAPRPSPTAQAADVGEEWIDVSIQMAEPDAPIVYGLGDELSETARNALERERLVFLRPDMIDVMLNDKFRNPVTGLAGLHLFLQAVEQGRQGLAGSGRAAPARMDTGGIAPELVTAEALANLGRLLGGDSGWDAPPDLLALRARANLPDSGSRLQAPPMFWAGWEALRTSVGTAGHAWIGRDLWQSMGDAVPRGPYMAWSPSRRSYRGRLERARRFDMSSVGEAAERSYPLGPASVLSAIADAGGQTWRGSDPLELASALGVPRSVSDPPKM